MKKGPFVRWSDLPGGRLPTASTPPPVAAAGEQDWIRNDSGSELPRGSVLAISGSVVDAGTEPDRYSSRILLRGDLPTRDDDPAFGILPKAVADGRAAPIVFAGVTFARLNGPAGRAFAGVRTGMSTLVTSESGPVTILHDPGPTGEERLAVVRIGAAGDAADSNSGGGNCECSALVKGTPLAFPGVCCIGHERWRSPSLLKTFYASAPDTWTTQHDDPDLDNPLEYSCDCSGPSTTAPSTSVPSSTSAPATSTVEPTPAVCVDQYDLVMTAGESLSTITLVPRGEAVCGCPITATYERVGRFDCQGSMTFQLVRFCNSHLLDLPRCLCLRPFVPGNVEVECAARIDIVDGEQYGIEDPPTVPAFSRLEFPGRIVISGLQLHTDLTPEPAYIAQLTLLNEQLERGVTLDAVDESDPFTPGQYYRRLRSPGPLNVMQLTLRYQVCDRTDPDSHLPVFESPGGQALGRLVVHLHRLLDSGSFVGTTWTYWRSLASDGSDDLFQEHELTRHPTLLENDSSVVPDDDEIAIDFVPQTLLMSAINDADAPTSDGYCDSDCDDCGPPPSTTLPPSTTPLLGYCCVDGVCVEASEAGCDVLGGTWWENFGICDWECDTPPTTSAPTTSAPPSTTVPPSTSGGCSPPCSFSCPDQMNCTNNGSPCCEGMSPPVDCCAPPTTSMPWTTLPPDTSPPATSPPWST